MVATPATAHSSRPALSRKDDLANGTAPPFIQRRERQGNKPMVVHYVTLSGMDRKPLVAPAGSNPPDIGPSESRRHALYPAASAQPDASFRGPPL